LVGVLPLRAGFKPQEYCLRGKYFAVFFFEYLLCHWFCLDERGGITLLASKCYGWKNLKRLPGLMMEAAYRALPGNG